MKYILTLSTILLAATACKTADSQLQDDIGFSNPGNSPDSKAYLTWVVGTKPAEGQADTRIICRAACDTNPRDKAAELGKDKITEVRNSCNKSSAESISFAAISADDTIEAYGAVQLANSGATDAQIAQAPSTGKVPETTVAINQSNKNLALMMRIWQSDGKYAPNDGVWQRDPQKVTWDDTLAELFDHDDLKFLPPSVKQARDSHNRTEQDRATIDPDNYTKDPFKIGDDTPRYDGACFGAVVAGTASTDNPAEEEATNAAEETETGKWETTQVGSNAVLIPDAGIYNYIRYTFGETLKEAAPDRFTGLSGNIYEFDNGDGYTVTKKDESNVLIRFTPTNAGVVVKKGTTPIATVKSKAFADFMQILIFDMTLNRKRVKLIKSEGPDEAGFITLRAFTPSPTKVYQIGKVRFKGDGEKGGYVEFQDPSTPIASQ